MKICACKWTELFAAIIVAGALGLFSGCWNPLSKLVIRLPDQLGPLTVGKSNYSDILLLLGQPEVSENIHAETTHEELLDLRYPSRGIEFTLDKHAQMRIVRIEVYRPFSVATAEGLRIGMPSSAARTLIVSKYGQPSSEWGGYMDWQIPNPVAIKSDDGLVVALKMLGSTQSP